jgi:hypothetical protein
LSFRKDRNHGTAIACRRFQKLIARLPKNSAAGEFVPSAPLIRDTG